MATLNDCHKFQDIWCKIIQVIGCIDTHRGTKDEGAATIPSETTWLSALKALKMDMTDDEMSNLYQALKPDNTQQHVSFSQWMYHWEHANISSTYYIKFQQLYTSLLQNIDRDNIKSSRKALCCYQWRLPKYQSLEIDLLCIGYLKQETKTFSDLFIPIDVMKMCMIYVYDNNNIIEKIKNLEQGVILKSGIFHYISCKFYISLKYDTDDQLRFELTWIAAPKGIAWAQCEFAFELMEKFWIVGRTRGGTDLFLDDPICIDHSFNRSQICYLDSFTLNLYITEFRTFEADDEFSRKTDLTDGKEYEYVPIIIDEEICQSDNCETYQWLLSEQELNQIKNSKPKDIIKSNIFIMHGLKFMIWL